MRVKIRMIRKNRAKFESGAIRGIGVTTHTFSGKQGPPTTIWNGLRTNSVRHSSLKWLKQVHDTGVERWTLKIVRRAATEESSKVGSLVSGQWGGFYRASTMHLGFQVTGNYDKLIDTIDTIESANPIEILSLTWFVNPRDIHATIAVTVSYRRLVHVTLELVD